MEEVLRERARGVSPTFFRPPEVSENTAAATQSINSLDPLVPAKQTAPPSALFHLAPLIIFYTHVHSNPGGI